MAEPVLPHSRFSPHLLCTRVFIKENHQHCALSGYTHLCSLVWPAFVKYTKMGSLWSMKNDLIWGPSAFLQVSCSNKCYVPWRSQPQLAPTCAGPKLRPRFWLLSTCTLQSITRKAQNQNAVFSWQQGEANSFVCIRGKMLEKIEKVKNKLCKLKRGGGKGRACSQTCSSVSSHIIVLTAH